MVSKISIVIPAYNEEPVIAKVVRGVREVLDELDYEYEILVINDGSSDATAAQAAEAGAQVVSHPYNIGNGAAVKTGIRNAQGDVIVLMDGDGQHSPRDIPRLLEFFPGYALVVGARTQNSQSTWLRAWGNRFYNAMASYISGHKIRDLTSGFRALDAGVAKTIVNLLPNGFSSPSTSTISIYRMGYPVKHISIEAAQRVGESKIKILRDGAKFVFIIARIGMLFVPLKICLPLSVVAMAPGLCVALVKLFLGRAWTIPIIISVTVGVLILVLGLISEQIALLRMSSQFRK
ncbi:MAG: glycosyltransferase family 2 protein [Deltaproteobacteria bacterium]|nr:glycosyltransferase family 2 protein [Deltaproteobacteria bacterium]